MFKKFNSNPDNRKLDSLKIKGQDIIQEIWDRKHDSVSGDQIYFPQTLLLFSPKLDIAQTGSCGDMIVSTKHIPLGCTALF